MEYNLGDNVVILERTDFPGGFSYAGAQAIIRPPFTDMSFFRGMESFLCLEITMAQDPALVGQTVFLHKSRVASAEP